jgi:diguanylate cyclase (GGDEF)-like protein/putative nucleotidyltransferase with HDIG domain
LFLLFLADTFVIAAKSMAATANTMSPAESAPKLTLSARLYIGAVIAAGVAALALTLVGLEVTNPVRFAVYLVCSAAASVFKVHLPGITGTMSAHFLFVLLAISDSSPGEAVLISLFGAVVQYVWHSRKRLRLVQFGFNLANISFAVVVCQWLFHSGLLARAGVDSAVLLALTACAYFVLNTLPVALVVALTERKSAIEVWQSCYFWSFPFYLVGATLVGVFQYMSSSFGWQRAMLPLPVVYTIYRSYRLYLDRLEAEKKHVEDQKRHAEELAGLHLRTIEALALAIEAKDHTTNEHLHRVQVYAQEISKDLGLNEVEKEALQAAALLHDIGKLAVPEHIISKPGKLTQEEFEKMKIHPIVGAEILERVQFPYPVVPIVAAHHEKWDGTGYPKGLAGEQIPIGARILSAVDCLDALASDRQYRRALPLDDAMAIVESQSGTAFDPAVVKVLARRYRELEQMARSRAAAEVTKLSTDVKIAPGVAPAAGYADESPTGHRAERSQPGDFLSSIAAARQEVQMLFEVAQTVGTSLSLSETLSVVAHRMQGLIPHDTFVVYLKREHVLKAEYASGVDAEMFGSLGIPVGEGISGWVAENSKPILNGNPTVEAGYLRDEAATTSLRSAISVPLEGVGGVLGVVSVYSRQPDVFTRDHLRILLAASSKLGLSIENSLRYEQAETNAGTDFLTGLPNGRSLFVHLQRQLVEGRKAGKPLTVLVCDVDDFKNVNDTYGHLEGNRILRELAAAMRSSCRAGDYIARMGGDEFVVVLTDTDEMTAARIRERLREASVGVAIAEFGAPVFSLSVGSVDSGEGFSEPDQILSEADRRMYKAKRERHSTALAARAQRRAAGSSLRIIR